ncbi:MAG TPA: tetratricopeptide repeat protein [Thermoanaerobaculia bacterium]
MKAPKARVVRLPPLALLALAAGLAGCGSSSMPPKENPVLADLVDYRSGLSMLREGRTDEAIQLLLRARTSSPRDPHVPNALGLALLYKKDYKSAVGAFSDALRLDASFVEARNNRGVAQMEAGRYNEAEVDFQAVLDGPATREKANAHYNLGLLHRRREAWRDAEREFSLTLADSPDNDRAFRERGLARMKLDDYKGALEDFLSVLKNEPKDPVANYQAAVCLLSNGRRDLAARYMQRTISAAPESDEGRRARRFLANEPAAPGVEP